MPKKASKTKTPTNPRQVKPAAYRSFRLQKPIKAAPTSKLPNAFTLFFASLRILAQHWKVFGGIILIYGVFNIVLVQSFSGGDLGEAKKALEDASSGQWGQVVNSIALFSYMAGSSGNVKSDVAGAYQMFLAVITSLAVIWALREVYASRAVRIRDTFYRGMYPLIPYLLLLAVVVLQLIPVVAGGFIYSLVSAGNVGLNGIEVLFWTTIFGLSVTASLYMLCSSLFALYIVCLPDMTPMAALRSARELVRNRRWTIIRKIIFLPVALFVAAAVVTIPVIFLLTPVAGFIFFLLSMAGLPVIHSYMYRLYRELL